MWACQLKFIEPQTTIWLAGNWKENNKIDSDKYCFDTNVINLWRFLNKDVKKGLKLSINCTQFHYHIFQWSGQNISCCQTTTLSVKLHPQEHTIFLHNSSNSLHKCSCLNMWKCHGVFTCDVYQQDTIS